MSQHVLWFPVADEPITLHTFNSDKRTVVQALLEEHGDGQYVEFGITVDGDEGGRLAYLVDGDDAARNTRAEEAVEFLTGSHFVIPGNACLANLPAGIVEQLGTGAFD